MPLKRRVMSISQTSLQTSEACACVTGCTTMVRHIRSFSGPSKLFWYTYRLDIYIVYTLYIHCIYICVRTPTLHECSLALAALRAASASEHSCNVRVCTYVDTMYTFNLFMYQKSFEVPTMWSYARKRKYYLVHPVTQAQVSEVWREVWEMNITFCFKGTFCRQIFSCFKHCFVT